MIINNNIAALNTHRQMGQVSNLASKSMERLSSGLRINRSADDAAGLAISEKMRGQIRGLTQASRNAQDGISLIQTAEGALNETHSILQRMNELATQASNGTLSDSDRQAVQNEITELSSEINRISESTKFNGQTLLNGEFGVQLDATTSTLKVDPDTNQVTAIDISGGKASTTYTLTDNTDGTMTLSDVAAGDPGNTQTINVSEGELGVLNFDKLGVRVSVDTGWVADTVQGTIVTGASTDVKLQIGSEEGATQQLGIRIGDMSTEGLSLDGVNVNTTAAAATAMTSIQNAIDLVSAERSRLGAYQNRLEHTINNVNTTAENLQAAESRIRDTDMAKEMMEFTKNNILSQASQAMLAQSNQMPQGVLQLLR